MINFVAIDFETATAERSSICEVGITVVKDGIIQESKGWLVQPEGNYYDPFNSFIHGITPADTKDSPTFPEVWKELKPYLEGNIVVAHNTSFDMYVLKATLDLYGLEYPNFKYLCTYRLAKRILTEVAYYNLGYLCETYHLSVEPNHRATDDSLGCAMLLNLEIQKAEVTDFESLVDKYQFNYGIFNTELHKGFTQIRVTKGIDPKSFVGDPSKVDEDSYFYGKSVCFTGTCSWGTRADLRQKIADIGGIPVDSVTKKTEILVVGQQDFRIVGSEGMSSKQKKALDLKSKGIDIEIMSETDFLSML